MEHFFLIFFSSVNAVPFSELVIIFIIIIIIILFLSLNNPEMQSEFIHFARDVHS